MDAALVVAELVAHDAVLVVELSREFLTAWDEHFPDVGRPVFPSATVTRVARRKVEVRDAEAVVDALDRLDRLDLAPRVIDEKGLADLVRKGKLAGLPEGVLEITDAVDIRVQERKEEDDGEGLVGEEAEGVPDAPRG